MTESPTSVEDAQGIVRWIGTLVNSNDVKQRIEEFGVELDDMAEAYKQRARKGTCPMCRRMYSITGIGALYRHGEGKCFTTTQLPLELLGAVFAIADLNGD